jgi:hypothetical protein
MTAGRPLAGAAGDHQARHARRGRGAAAAARVRSRMHLLLLRLALPSPGELCGLAGRVVSTRRRVPHPTSCARDSSYRLALGGCPTVCREQQVEWARPEGEET